MIKCAKTKRTIEAKYYNGLKHAGVTIFWDNTRERTTSVELDRQGVDALIKELEEVREKLPKPKVKKTIWVNLYDNGSHYISSSKYSLDEVTARAEEGHGPRRVECREITWEVSADDD